MTRMGNELKLNHRLRIDILVGKGNFLYLDQYLGKIAGKGFSVAGVPFQILDSILVSDNGCLASLDTIYVVCFVILIEIFM